MTKPTSLITNSSTTTANLHLHIPPAANDIQAIIESITTLHFITTSQSYRTMVLEELVKSQSITINQLVATQVAISEELPPPISLKKGDDYWEWTHKVLQQLGTIGLRDVVEEGIIGIQHRMDNSTSSMKHPLTGCTNEEIKRITANKDGWKARRKASVRAYTYISRCLIDNTILLVNHIPSDNAHGLWVALRSVFGAGKENVTTQMHTLESIKQDKNEPVLKYYTRLMAALNVLVINNEYIPEAIIKTRFFSGLKYGFASVTKDWEVNEDGITLKDMVNLISIHEEATEAESRRQPNLAITSDHQASKPTSIERICMVSTMCPGKPRYIKRRERRARSRIIKQEQNNIDSMYTQISPIHPFYIDTAASKHCISKDVYLAYSQVKKNTTIILANKEQIKAPAIGCIAFHTPDGNNMRISNVMQHNNIKMNIISTSALEEEFGTMMDFQGKNVTVMDKEGRTIMSGKKEGSLYKVNLHITKVHNRPSKEVGDDTTIEVTFMNISSPSAFTTPNPPGSTSSSAINITDDSSLLSDDLPRIINSGFNQPNTSSNLNDESGDEEEEEDDEKGQVLAARLDRERKEETRRTNEEIERRSQNEEDERFSREASIFSIGGGSHDDYLYEDGDEDDLLFPNNESEQNEESKKANAAMDKYINKEVLLSEEKEYVKRTFSGAYIKKIDNENQLIKAIIKRRNCPGGYSKADHYLNLSLRPSNDYRYFLDPEPRDIREHDTTKVNAVEYASIGAIINPGRTHTIYQSVFDRDYTTIVEEKEVKHERSTDIPTPEMAQLLAKYVPVSYEGIEIVMESNEEQELRFKEEEEISIAKEAKGKLDRHDHCPGNRVGSNIHSLSLSPYWVDQFEYPIVGNKRYEAGEMPPFTLKCQLDKINDLLDKTLESLASRKSKRDAIETKRIIDIQTELAGRPLEIGEAIMNYMNESRANRLKEISQSASDRLSKLHKEYSRWFQQIGESRYVGHWSCHCIPGTFDAGNGYLIHPPRCEDDEHCYPSGSYKANETDPVNPYVTTCAAWVSQQKEIFKVPQGMDARSGEVEVYVKCSYPVLMQQGEYCLNHLDKIDGLSLTRMKDNNIALTATRAIEGPESYKLKQVADRALARFERHEKTRRVNVINEVALRMTTARIMKGDETPIESYEAILIAIQKTYSNDLKKRLNDNKDYRTQQQFDEDLEFLCDEEQSMVLVTTITGDLYAKDITRDQSIGKVYGSDARDFNWKHEEWSRYNFNITNKAEFEGRKYQKGIDASRMTCNVGRHLTYSTKPNCKLRYTHDADGIARAQVLAIRSIAKGDIITVDISRVGLTVVTDQTEDMSVVTTIPYSVSPEPPGPSHAAMDDMETLFRKCSVMQVPIECRHPKRVQLTTTSDRKTTYEEKEKEKRDKQGETKLSTGTSLDRIEKNTRLMLNAKRITRSQPDAFRSLLATPPPEDANKPKRRKKGPAPGISSSSSSDATNMGAIVVANLESVASAAESTTVGVVQQFATTTGDSMTDVTSGQTPLTTTAITSTAITSTDSSNDVHMADGEDDQTNRGGAVASSSTATVTSQKGVIDLTKNDTTTTSKSSTVVEKEDEERSYWPSLEDFLLQNPFKFDTSPLFRAEIDGLLYAHELRRNTKYPLMVGEGPLLKVYRRMNTCELTRYHSFMVETIRYEYGDDPETASASASALASPTTMNHPGHATAEVGMPLWMLTSESRNILLSSVDESVYKFERDGIIIRALTDVEDDEVREKERLRKEAEDKADLEEIERIKSKKISVVMTAEIQSWRLKRMQNVKDKKEKEFMKHSLESTNKRKLRFMQLKEKRRKEREKEIAELIEANSSRRENMRIEAEANQVRDRTLSEAKEQTNDQSAAQPSNTSGGDTDMVQTQANALSRGQSMIDGNK